MKETSVKFGHMEVVGFHYDTIKINRKGMQGIINIKGPEMKPDPDKFLIVEHNVPENIPIETVIRNSSAHNQF